MPVRDGAGDATPGERRAGGSGSGGQVLRAPDPGAFAHQLMLYRSLDELIDAVVPFLDGGLRAGDATVMVATPDVLAAVSEAMDSDAAASVAFKPSPEEYADVGPVLAGFQALLDEHTSAGRRVRLIAEPPLGSVSRPHRRELCHNDAAVNEVACVPGASVVCLVDARVTPEEAVTAMRRCHPEVVEDGTPRISSEYTDPATLLAIQRREPLPPAGDAAELVGPTDATTARAFVDQQLQGVLDERRRNDFVTAVNEVVINAFTHAVIDRLRLWCEEGRVVCEVGDGGNGLSDPLAGYRKPEPWQTSGWGLWLARQLTHVIEVSTGHAGSTFRLHATIPEASADG